MSKTNLSLMACFFACTVYAQVGINTDTPNSTLDVKKNVNAPTSSKDGIIPPILNKQDLANKIANTYSNLQTGAIVYVNNISNPTGSPASLSQVSNIDKIGFYYFDGSTSKWSYLDTNTNPGNIYLNDGTLTGTRTLSQGNNKLIYTDTFRLPDDNETIATLITTNNNSITLGASSSTDTNPSLVINPVTRRTGINIDQPKATLEVHPGIYSNTKVEDGIIIPRLSKDEINKKMNDSSNPYKVSAVTDFAGLRTSHVGTLLYIFNTSDVTLSPVHTSLTNASTDGFYYLDENRVWQKLLTTNNTTALIAANADSSKDAWVDNSTNTRVELGTTSSGAARTAGTNVSIQDDGRLNLGYSGIADAGIHLVGEGDGWKDDIRLDSYSGTATANPGANFRMYSSRGTQAAPVNLTSGNSLGQIAFHGRINGSFSTASARIWADYKGDGTTNLSNLTFSVNGYGNPSLVIDSNQNVGIGTSSPTVNLEVKGNPTVTTSLDGVIPPKLTGDQLKAKTYTVAQDGAIVFVTEPASEINLTNQTENVNMVGLYYFDGPTLKWNYQGNNPLVTNFRSTTGQPLNLTSVEDQVITFAPGDSNTNMATYFDDATDTFKIKYKGTYQFSGFVGYNANQPTFASATDFIAVNLKLQKRDVSTGSWKDVTGIRFVTVGIQCGVGTAIQLPTTILNLEKNDYLRLVIQRPDISINGINNKTFGNATFDHINIPNGQSFTKMITLTKIK